jgi:phosphoglycolate phosphatase-like HAD superfamily hydrolase
MEYDAVVFDNDGVLTTLTDRDLLRRGIREAFAAHGVEEPDDADVEAMMSVGVEDVTQVCERHDIDAEAFWQRREEIVCERQIDVLRSGEKTLYDDARAVSSLGARAGIVSNNQQRTIDHIVEQFDLDWAEVAYGREPTLAGVRRKKPTPYYLEQALSDLGVAIDDGPNDESVVTEEVLYVGDSPKDVVAARRAGIQAAFIRRTHRTGVELPHEPAHEVESVEELVEELSG